MIAPLLALALAAGSTITVLDTGARIAVARVNLTVELQSHQTVAMQVEDSANGVTIVDLRYFGTGFAPVHERLMVIPDASGETFQVIAMGGAIDFAPIGAAVAMRLLPSGQAVAAK
jgi:hypothetical protein